MIQLDNRASPGMFKSRDLGAMMLLGSQAALAIDNARLVARLRVAEERLSGENLYLKGREQNRRFADIIGEAPAMKAVLKQLEKVIDTRATVCIEGETGTGKELVASAVHYQSQRKDKLFVAQNCAALPETLLESELFGHKKGAFTGADQDKKGLFELADQGTLFLDEVGEMAMGLQAKLLRVLQEGTVRPVGAVAEKQIDVRILCATNRDPRRRGRGRKLSPGPVLPPHGVPDLPAAASRTARGHPASGRVLPGQVHQGVPQERHGDRAGRPWTPCARSRGQATFASSKTRCSAW